MVSNYNLNRKASIELDEAINWYHKKGGKKLASKFFSEYQKTKNRILENPFQFEKIMDEFRHANLDKFPFLIIFHATKTDVSVLAIFHTSRNPDEWQSRI